MLSEMESRPQAAANLQRGWIRDAADTAGQELAAASAEPSLAGVAGAPPAWPHWVLGSRLVGC